MSDENQKCPECNGSGGYGVRTFDTPWTYPCKKCEGTGFVSRSIEESPGADRGPRNASDRAFGAAALRRECKRRVREARRKKDRARELSCKYTEHHYAGQEAALSEFLKLLPEQPRKAPAENDGDQRPIPREQL